MYRTANTLSQNIRFKSAELLNRHLAAAIDLHTKVKQAHWNVRGPALIATPAPGAHVIDEIVVPAVPFAWSMLLMG